MNTLDRKLAGIGAAVLLTGCAGVPVNLGSRVDSAVPISTGRTITAESCGFQLALFIPIKVNDRAERAYMQLENAAAGDFIIDVQVQASWTYGFVGTLYCTRLQAKAIRAKSS